MRYYVLVLMMCWASILAVLLMSWLILLLGMDLGRFTIILPVIITFFGLAFVSRLDWFDENIRTPLAETLEYGDWIEVVIHLQLFTLIVGMIGLGLGILCLTALYPVGFEMILKGAAAGNQEWQNFTKYLPFSVISGFFFGFLLYTYLFADARGIAWLTRTVIIGGFAIFFGLGLFWGDTDFFVIGG